MHQLQGGEREMLWFFSLFEILFMFGIIGFIVLYVFRVVKLFSRSTSDNNPNANQNARRTGNVGDRYSTINSHYSNATLSGSIGNINIKKTSNNGDPNHQHAYEHKVTPVDEASVINMHEERKEAYMEKKRQRKEDCQSRRIQKRRMLCLLQMEEHTEMLTENMGKMVIMELCQCVTRKQFVARIVMQ